MSLMNQNETLAYIGFEFPQNKDQLVSLKRLFENYQFKSRVEEVDPEKIIERLKLKKANKPKGADYFKRTVLAAEIVSQLSKDRSMGHLKLEKMIYLCKHFVGMQIYTSFAKHQMGPYDPQLIRSIDNQFENRKWFKYDQDSTPKYIPLNKSGEHEALLDKYFSKEKSKLEFIIKTFGKFNAEQIELVVTIYDCWLKLIEECETFSHDIIVEKIYAWSKHKEIFERKRIIRAIDWMKEKKIVPK